MGIKVAYDYYLFMVVVSSELTHRVFDYGGNKEYTLRAKAADR